MIAIECKNLSKKFGNNFVIKNLNLSINSGICTGIIGRSGSGKTTLLKILGGLEEATNGEIFIFQDVACKKNRQNIGFIFQDFNLFNNMTAMENIKYATKFLNQNQSEINCEIEKYIDLFSIQRNILSQYPQNLSGGQKQRIAIIRALALKSKILLMDEPTASLDETSKNEVLSVFLKLKQEGLTSVIVTHDNDFAKKCCDEVIDFSQINRR